MYAIFAIPIIYIMIGVKVTKKSIESIKKRISSLIRT